MTSKANIRLGEWVATVGVFITILGTAAGGVAYCTRINDSVKANRLVSAQNATRSIETARKQAGLESKLDAVHDDVKEIKRLLMER